MTGTAAVVKRWVSPPTFAPHETFRRNRRWASSAMSIRCAARVLPERVDPRLAGRGGLGLARALRHLHVRDLADDEDLLPVDGHLRRAREPVVRKPAREPAAQLVHRHLAHRSCSLCVFSSCKPDYNITQQHNSDKAAIPAGRYRPAHAANPSTDPTRRARDVVRLVRQRLLHLAIGPGSPGRGAPHDHRLRPGDRRVRRRHDGGHVPELPHPPDAARRQPRARERGDLGEREADPSPARDAPPDGERRHRARGRSRRCGLRADRVGVADLRPVRLRPGDLAGHLDGPPACGPDPGRAYWVDRADERQAGPRAPAGPP